MPKKIILKNLVNEQGRALSVSVPDNLTEKELQEIRAAGVKAGKEFKAANDFHILWEGIHEIRICPKTNQEIHTFQ
jgi:hypothetical protein